MSESPQQEYQRLVYTFYTLRMQLETSMNTMTQVQNLLEGVSISNSVIEEIMNAKKDHEVILPIGNFAYIKAKLPDPDTILVSVGRKTLVERNTKQALDFIRKKREELQKQQDSLQKTIDQVSAQLKEIEPIINQIQQQQQGAARPPSL